MTTCRDVIIQAVEAFEGLAPGDDLTVDEINRATTFVGQQIRRISEGRGPLRNVDVTADYTPGEDERARVQSGYTVSITLPNSIVIATGEGTSASADDDEATYRAPRDGSRIEIVGLSSTALYLYRADTNTWVNIVGLTADSDFPLSANYAADFAAWLSVRLCTIWPARASLIPTPEMRHREAMANLRLFTRPGVTRTVTQAEYF